LRISSASTLPTNNNQTNINHASQSSDVSSDRNTSALNEAKFGERVQESLEQNSEPSSENPTNETDLRSPESVDTDKSEFFNSTSVVSSVETREYVEIFEDYSDNTFDEGSQFVYVDARGVNIDTGEGNDVIMGHASSILGKRSHIEAGSGNDFVSLTGHHMLIEGNEGGDILIGTGNYIRAEGGDGNDKITLNGTSINHNNDEDFDRGAYGGAGEDEISLYGDWQRAFGGDDNDTINLYGAGHMAEGGDGDDTISNHGGYRSEISGGAGNDTFNVSGSRLTVNGDAGNDTFNLDGDTSHPNDFGQSVVDGGEGEDTFNVNSENDNGVLIEGGSGKDTINFDYELDPENISIRSVESTDVQGKLATTYELVSNTMIGGGFYTTETLLRFSNIEEIKFSNGYTLTPNGTDFEISGG